MVAVSIKISSKPSSSKGWGRYALALSSCQAIVTSSSGNEWVSAPHAGEAAEGAELALKIQVMLKIGKTKRQEITTETHALVAAEGESCEVDLTPGSQGLRLSITGARLVEAQS
jgi:hypothetical protein